ncbi:uncharacterized protein UV8b_00723 [Ustilaginoidea virens]|uniref:Gem-associated protein 5 TPR domain-containing protein n=2 Tax=Ustilaginoidea virens TaxID=1159556 RepID=A0A8E5HJM4_USTVR|nr:uncharacterized protein UV8b_00723 [Ustilaginoidea virens]QUC16482.1 hypothetical protein UV8b_00723 [Ustilaginoidea virens]
MSASSRNRTAKSSGGSSTARGDRNQDVTTMPPVGGGRLTVSYDAGQVAIVWDLMTGDEVARFTSYETLTAAAWMRNGNVAFGDTQGNIILFEPTTSQALSSRTPNQIAVTALAPSSDCRTFAIGYQNGSLLVATLQPSFTTLHNLTTSRAPSPIVTLAWHASSSRQKSNMLAVQTHDGDLRVWSVAKSYSAGEPAKVVRILRRRESSVAGPNWMGWSKNGRIIQYSDSETLSWDVRTKHVTFDSIPTLEHVRGLAVYGPGASLFTVGPNGTVQQFDLNSPSIMVAKNQHPANHLPPSPPNSVEELGGKTANSVTTIHTSESESSSVPFEIGVSESDEDQASPFVRFSRRPHVDSSGGEMSCESASLVSSRSGLSSLSKSSASSRTPNHHQGSVRSRGMTEYTFISAGSSLKSSNVGRDDLDNYSLGYSLPSSVPSMTSSRPRHRPSRLRHEVPRSPDDNRVHDLFKFTRTRLSDIPYKHPMNADPSRLTNDDLRKQMLSTIFGWHGSVEDLIRDEMSRHPAGSANRILLAKWLGDMDADVMVGSSENMTSSDWMLLALSGIGGQPSQHKLGRAYVQRLLESGDVHAAVTIMLGMGDNNDAIEIYISHKRYMEALILTCIAFPSVWERQAAIVRKWGEWAVQRGQQQLAIRCFACTDQESSEPWTSPSAAQLTFQSIDRSIPETLSPPLSPPDVQRGPRRSVAKTSALKLITSFGDLSEKPRFYSQGDGGQTPIAAGVTPIADSAVSTAVHDATTALLRPSSNSRFNTPTSARPGGSSYGRGRLPSIGETFSDPNCDALQTAQTKAQAPQESRQGSMRMLAAEQDNQTIGISSQRAATASPMMMMRDGYRKVVRSCDGERPPSPNQDIPSTMHETRSNHRNGSRDRIPRGINLELENLEQQAMVDVNCPDPFVSSSARFHWPSRRRGPGSVASSITSNSSAGRSLRANQRQRDEYINSFEAALHFSKRIRSHGGSIERARESSRDGHASRERRAKSREASERRGRSCTRGWTKTKHSPTSPIPMSPEDLAKLCMPKCLDIGEPVNAGQILGGQSFKTGSRTSSPGIQRRSPDGRPPLQEGILLGRGIGRYDDDDDDDARQSSPPPPVPLSAIAALHYQGSEDEQDFKKAMMEQEIFRAKHGRSVSRGGIGGGLDAPMVAKVEWSESYLAEAAEAPDMLFPAVSHVRAASTDQAGDLRKMKDERQRKKEQAARELEERRKSLAKRPQAPLIPHPNEFNNPATRDGVELADARGNRDLPPRCATEPPKSTCAMSGQHVGLPATPRAMRLMREAENSSKLTKDASDVPRISPLYSQSQHEASRSCPRNEPGLESLALLPSTVYQPPPRLGIHRSMSAPIPDEPVQARYTRKASLGGEVRGIDEVMNNGQRRRSQEEPVPPPPAPPAPPLLKELQHLAMPPPPPPAPLPHAKRSSDGGAFGSGMIEIVMDDDDIGPVTAAPNDGVASVAPPAPPSRGHNRGGSAGDGGFPGRFSKTGEPMGSVSRSRKGSVTSTQSPPLETAADAAFHQGNCTLRSPVTSVPPPIMYDPDAIRSPIELGVKHVSTGLDTSDMI